MRIFETMAITVCSLLLSLSSLSNSVFANNLQVDLGDPDCDSVILVSNWDDNNVKIYDGCSGDFVRNLDSQHLINGPLGISQTQDGDLLVVSESNARLIRYDRQSLSQASIVMGDDPATEAIETNIISKPSAVTIDSDGQVYLASYGNNSVVRVNPDTWQIEETLLPANSGHISGIDAGIQIYNGDLYLPGYDSDNIIKVNLQSKSVTSVVSPGTGGLDAPRTVLVRGNEIAVTSERSNAVLLYDRNTGSFIKRLIQITRPTGMVADGEQHFLVSTRRTVLRVRNDGSDGKIVVTNGAGNLTMATFVYRFYKFNHTIDSDNDGLSDNDEIDIYGTDPQNPDTDNDSLLDGDEVNSHNTDPLLADTDSDGMPDGYEIQHTLLATVNDAQQDLDLDTLSNYYEYQTGTLPNNPDTDGDGDNDNVDSDPLVPNYPPLLSGAPQTYIQQDQAYHFQPLLEYPGDHSTISFSLQNSPGWLTLNSSTGSLSGTPTNQDVAVTENVTLVATNGYHQTELAPFTLEVININDAPVLNTAIPNSQVIIGQNFSLNIANYFNDIDLGDSLTFAAAGLPNGLSISTAGVISGVIESSGSYTASITAHDTSNASVSAEFTITVENQASSSSGGTLSLGSLLVVLLLGRLNKKSYP